MQQADTYVFQASTKHKNHLPGISLSGTSAISVSVGTLVSFVSILMTLSLSAKSLIMSGATNPTTFPSTITSWKKTSVKTLVLGH